jgi:GT2 family glycosyltransferase
LRYLESDVTSEIEAAERTLPVRPAAPSELCADITVVIVTMDRPEALARCVDSVLNGTRRPQDVVIVDLASHAPGAGTTGDVATSNDVQVIRLAHPPCGLAAARNVGLSVAQGTWVAITDDDCVPGPLWIATIERAFNSAVKPDVVTGRVVPLGPDVPGLYAVSSRSSTTRSEYTWPAVPWHIGTGGNFAARRDLLVRVGRYDERLGAGSSGRAGEDIELIYRLLRAGARILYVPDAVVEHERQDARRRTASRFNYGHGIGAFCGLWITRDLAGISVLVASWLSLRLRLLVKAALRRNWRTVREESQVLHGTWRGMKFGFGIQRQGWVWQWRKRLSPAARRLVRPAFLGTLRRTTPVSDCWGFDRGQPVDRYYIERFLTEYRRDIHGRVMEILDSTYTDRFGVNVTRSDVLDIDPQNTKATFTADLAAADAVPDEIFDSVIVTQTLQLIFDTSAALRHLHRMLRPGGVLLATVPAVSRVSKRVGVTGDYWRFTVASCSRLAKEVFGDDVTITAFGNVLSGIAFLTGMAKDELSPEELDVRDEHFPVLIGIRAVKTRR